MFMRLVLKRTILFTALNEKHFKRIPTVAKKMFFDYEKYTKLLFFFLLNSIYSYILDYINRFAKVISSPKLKDLLPPQQCRRRGAQQSCFCSITSAPFCVKKQKIQTKNKSNEK